VAKYDRYLSYLPKRDHAPANSSSRVWEEYYPKFLDRFPTLGSLGEASLDEVLALWSGLGYYSRARNLHRCAKETSGILPVNIHQLEKLPGIGRYTASAICSFGLGQSVPVVDTNIARAIKRLFAIREASTAKVWKQAEHFLNIYMPREHNLALMDLGAMVCLPKNPQCTLCPLLESCKGREYPEQFTQTKKKNYESLELFYGVYTKAGKVALTPANGNMYKAMLELPAVDPIEEDFIATFKHSYTKYRLNVNLYTMKEFVDEIVWVDLEDFDNAPISSLTKKAKRFFKYEI